MKKALTLVFIVAFALIALTVGFVAMKRNTDIRSKAYDDNTPRQIPRIEIKTSPPKSGFGILNNTKLKDIPDNIIATASSTPAINISLTPTKPSTLSATLTSKPTSTPKTATPSPTLDDASL